MKCALLVAGLVAALLLVACGGDDDDAADAVAGVCTETETAVGEDMIKVDEPGSGDDVLSPLHVSGEVTSPDGEFWITVVGADGERIIDYPGRGAEPEVASPFDQEVPFSVFEEAPACLWVYLDSAFIDDARRIPITLVPDAAEEPTS
jgi:hypothetical protein